MSHADEILARLQAQPLSDAHNEKIALLIRAIAPNLHNVDILASSLQDKGPGTEKLLAPAGLFKIYVKTIESLDVSERIHWYSTLLAHYAASEAELRRAGSTMDKEFVGMQKSETQNGTVFYIDADGKNHWPTEPLINWRRAAGFCQNCAMSLAIAARTDIFSATNIQERYKLASAAYLIAGTQFIDKILYSPEDIRKLIVLHPERDSIAFNHRVPRMGLVMPL